MIKKSELWQNACYQIWKNAFATFFLASEYIDQKYYSRFLLILDYGDGLKQY